MREPVRRGGARADDARPRARRASRVSPRPQQGRRVGNCGEQRRVARDRRRESTRHAESSGARELCRRRVFDACHLCAQRGRVVFWPFGSGTPRRRVTRPASRGGSAAVLCSRAAADYAQQGGEQAAIVESQMASAAASVEVIDPSGGPAGSASRMAAQRTTPGPGTNRQPRPRSSLYGRKLPRQGLF